MGIRAGYGGGWHFSEDSSCLPRLTRAGVFTFEGSVSGAAEEDGASKRSESSSFSFARKEGGIMFPAIKDLRSAKKYASGYILA